ncbi:MAG: ImmA/IrrE family metallo-endopeptidase, partial [Polyangiaceae bacterium]
MARALKLKVPVDVQGILNGRADVEYDVFPAGVDCDAVVLRKDGGRPRVVINPGSHENRLRFTIAHELGHIVLPWQIGTLFCHARIAYIPSDELVREIEKDAHQFASELLVPGDWLRARLPLADVKPVLLCEALVDVASTAKVSVIAAALSAGRLLGPETLLVLTQGDVVSYAINAPGSKCIAPDKGARFVAEEHRSVGADLGSKPYGKGKVVHVVHFHPTTQDASSDPSTPAKEILSDILRDLGATGAERLRLQQVVAGVVGYANNLSRESHPLSMLRQR